MKSKSYATFRNMLLKLGRPIQRAIYSISNPVGLNLLTRQRLGWIESSLMNTDLTTTFKIALTLCVVIVALKLNQLPIFYCTVIIIQTSV